jgi:hypothetical protein
MEAGMVGETVHSIHDCYTGKNGERKRIEMKDMEQVSMHYYKFE